MDHAARPERPPLGRSRRVMSGSQSSIEMTRDITVVPADEASGEDRQARFGPRTCLGIPGERYPRPADETRMWGVAQNGRADKWKSQPWRRTRGDYGDLVEHRPLAAV